MKQKKSAPRNPLVAVAKFRQAGAHGQSEKARRREAKMELQREFGVKAAQHPFKVPGPGSSPGAPTSRMKSVSMRTSKQGVGA